MRTLDRTEWVYGFQWLLCTQYVGSHSSGAASLWSRKNYPALQLEHTVVAWVGCPEHLVIYHLFRLRALPLYYNRWV